MAVLRRCVCSFVAASLGLRHGNKLRSASADFLEIGMATGDNGSQMLCLRVDGGLALVIGSNAMPLVDLVGFQDDAYSVDTVMVRQMVDAAFTADPRYTPTIAKREARKLGTQAMYASWQKAYRALRKRSPGKSVSWYSQQIAKTDIALGRNASTIKKNMEY